MRARNSTAFTLIELPFDVLRAVRKCKSAAFTLIELLVVIAIIGLLVAMLLPALQAARARSRRTNCKSNLHQFAVAVEIYKNDFPDFYPPWLSTLYPVYMGNADVYLCPNDDSRGEEGGVPEWFSTPEYGASQYPETDDTKRRDEDLAPLTSEFRGFEKEAKKARNTEIKVCSYIFEFAAGPCSWWYSSSSNPDTVDADYLANKDKPEKTWADGDSNGVVTWREAKVTEQKGTEYKGGEVKVDYDKAYGGRVPMLRCFWHAREGKSLARETVLNLACENKNIYESPIFGEGWKQAGGK